MTLPIRDMVYLYPLHLTGNPKNMLSHVTFWLDLASLFHCFFLVSYGHSLWASRFHFIPSKERDLKNMKLMNTQIKLYKDIPCSKSGTVWCFGTCLFSHILISYVGNSNPNWLSYFSEGLVETTNLWNIWINDLRISPEYGCDICFVVPGDWTIIGVQLGKAERQNLTWI